MKKSNKYYIYLIPAIIIIIFFIIWPLITTFRASAVVSDNTNESSFEKVLNDNSFRRATINTISIIFISIPISIISSFCIAYLLMNKYNNKERRKISSLLLSQYFISIYAISMSFFFLYGQDINLINKIFDTNVKWTFDSDGWTSIWTISLFIIWRMSSFNIVLFMKGLSKINYKSKIISKIDNLTFFQKLKIVIIPEIKSVLKIILITSYLTAFLFHSTILFGKYSDSVTYGGQTIISYIINFSVRYDKQGEAAAATILLMIATILVIFTSLIISFIYKYIKNVREVIKWRK